MSYSSSGTAQGLNEIAAALLTIDNNTQIYLYKDSNGTIRAQRLEQYTNSNNFGYAYNFISGDVIYSATPVLTIATIPWTYPYTVLTAVDSDLWNTRLTFWIDGKEPYSINTSLQKIVSKGYDAINQFIENTNDYSFAYSSNTIDMTNYSKLESSTTITQKQYFKVAIACQIPTQNVSNKVIFKHNDLEIKIGSQTVADTTTQYCIGLYDNGSYCKGITFKPSDTTFNYYIFVDNASNLTVSGNNCLGGVSGSFSYGSDYTFYINDDATNAKNAAIKLYEILYYQSTSNDIAATNTNMWDYLSARWSLSTYADTHNVLPVDNPYDDFLASGSKHLYNGNDCFIPTSLEWRSLNNTSGGAIGTSASNSAVFTSIGGCSRGLTLNTSGTGTFTNLLYDAGHTVLTSFTFCYLFRKTFAGGIDSFRFGAASYPQTLDFSIAVNDGRVTFDGHYRDFDTAFTTNTWYCITVVYNNASNNFSGSNLIYRVNGVSKSQTAYSGGTITRSLASNAGLIQGDTSAYYGGIYINNTAMSQANYEKVEGYLVHSMFGDGNTLDSGHPYYGATSPY